MVDSVAVIHLERATERLPVIENIRALFPSLSVYNAKDGSDWVNSMIIGKKHPWTGTDVSKGVLGCAHSHIDLIHAAVRRGDKTIMIFEDDCEMNRETSINTIMSHVHGANMLGNVQIAADTTSVAEAWDILLLGANEYVESEATSVPEYRMVKRFWGTHALILRESAMRAALQVFADAQREGIFLPADWMYNEAIKGGLRCIGPANPFSLCRQKEGFVSYITGTPRINRA